MIGVTLLTNYVKKVGYERVSATISKSMLRKFWKQGKLRVATLLSASSSVFDAAFQSNVCQNVKLYVSIFNNGMFLCCGSSCAV